MTFPADTGCLLLGVCSEQQFKISPVLLTVAGDAPRCSGAAGDASHPLAHLSRRHFAGKTTQICQKAPFSRAGMNRQLGHILKDSTTLLGHPTLRWRRDAIKPPSPECDHPEFGCSHLQNLCTPRDRLEEDATSLV